VTRGLSATTRALATACLAVAASLVLAAPAHPGGPAADSDVKRGTFRASDGALIEYFTHGDPATAPILISPAFTGDAQLYVTRFGAALPDNFVVGVQLRGHGGSGGCSFLGSDLCSASQGPRDGEYLAFRMRRLAKDLREAKQHLGLGRAGFIGHSIGMNVVSQYLHQFGADDFGALFAYDESPRILKGGSPAPADFPLGVVSYPRSVAKQLRARLAVFDGESYPQVPASVRAMLGGPAGDLVFNPVTEAPSFVLTQKSWGRWRAFADRINGTVLSRMFWSSVSSD